MSVLGVISCQTLELEFAYLVVNDPDVVSITVMKDHYSDGIVEGLERYGGLVPKSILYIGEHVSSPSNGLEVVVRVMKIGLHAVIKDLRAGVVGAVKEMAPYVDAILLGYGLCGNAMDNPDELFSSVRIPVFLPMEEDHPVDDCVGLIIGGRENYYEEQCKCAGTMFMNSGFARHWETLGENMTGPMGSSLPAMLKRLMANYKRTLLLPTPVMSEEEMASSIREFNETYGLRSEVRPGTLEILNRTWRTAKESVLAAKG
jgi:Protein of unknown function (DUF1638)